MSSHAYKELTRSIGVAVRFFLPDHEFHGAYHFREVLIPWLVVTWGVTIEGDMVQRGSPTSFAGGEWGATGDVAELA